jgi:hypothetical protein
VWGTSRGVRVKCVHYTCALFPPSGSPWTSWPFRGPGTSWSPRASWNSHEGDSMTHIRSYDLHVIQRRGYPIEAHTNPTDCPDL